MTVLRLNNNASKTFGGRASLTLWETLQGMLAQMQQFVGPVIRPMFSFSRVPQYYHAYATKSMPEVCMVTKKVK